MQFSYYPRLPDLISQSFINQQGFDVEFGEHWVLLGCSKGHFSLRKLAICAENGCK